MSRFTKEREQEIRDSEFKGEFRLDSIRELLAEIDVLREINEFLAKGQEGDVCPACGCEFEKGTFQKCGGSIVNEAQTLRAERDEYIERYTVENQEALNQHTKCEELKKQLQSQAAQCAVMKKALEELQLNHEHNTNNPDYCPLSDTYDWCSICSTKVGLNEDIARQAFAIWEKK